MKRTVGVEEEFLLVDPTSGQARAVGGAVLLAAGDDADLTTELQREQVETGTRPCRDLADLGHELRRTREQAREAARAVGVALAPLGTSPLPVSPTVTPDARYRRMIERFGMTASEQLTCGCHVHVAIDSDEEGVAALDRIRPWLAPLLALSANSPFWNGADSGYASFRSQVWARGPSVGPTDLFGSAAGYRDVTSAMLGTDTLLDEGMLYFDARLSRTHPTLEVRVSDVCREPDDAVLIAALVRALVETAVQEWRDDRPPDPVRTGVLRLAAWRAARSGLDGTLVDPSGWRAAPAADILRSLIGHVEPTLEEAGELEVVRELLAAVLRRNTGAARQREVLGRTGDLAAVVVDAVRQGS
jgi:glutamate---cysteine ligase / carboxylate-amine ligase